MTMRTKTTKTMAATLAAAAALTWLAPLHALPSQAATASAPKKSDPVAHALSGTVEAVDTAAKTVAVKTADGTVEVVKVTDRTTVTGLKGGAKYTDLAAEKGAHVVVHYTGDGANKTATGIDSFGKGTEKVLKGTVVDVDKAGKTVTIKTAQGTEEVVRLSDRATVDTGEGIATGVVKGSEVTVHFTEASGAKVAHFFKKL
jgi:arginine repressor